MVTSTNSGATWSAPITVAGGTTTGRDGMPGCANLPGQPTQVMCVFETTEGLGRLSIKSVLSVDDGGTWPISMRRQVYAAAGANIGLYLF
jgi:hypothetical protein